MDNTKYTKDLEYECRDRIGKIHQPYLYKQDFSYKQVKPDYWEIVSKSDEIYIGEQDVDDLSSFLHVKEKFDRRKS